MMVMSDAERFWYRVQSKYWRSQISQCLALNLDPYCRIAVTGKVPNSESLQVNSMRSPSVDTVPEQSPADVSPDWYLALYLLV